MNQTLPFGSTLLLGSTSLPFLYEKYVERYLAMFPNKTEAIKPYVILISDNMTLIYILFFFVILVLMAILIVAIKIFGASKLPLNGPLHLPIIGSYYEFTKNKHRFYNWLLDCAKKYGTKGVFYFSIPVKSPYIIILKPEYLKEVLKDNMNGYHREPIYRACNELLGQGIFNVDGNLWQQQRRIASHGFNTKQLNNNALRCFEQCANNLVDKINEYVDKGMAFDIKDLFFRVTVDSICKIAFDYNVDAVISDDIPSFAMSIDKCTRHMFQRIIDPLWIIKKIISVPDELEYKKNIKEIDNKCYEIIDKRLESLSNPTEGKKLYDESHDILSLFINECFKNYENNYEETISTLEEIFQDDTKKYLRDIVVSFIIAGRDTTASTLSWLFFELLSKPSIIEELEKDIAMSGPLENIYQYKDNLQLVNAAFSETLRLHPPVPMDVKFSKNDTVLVSNNGSSVVIPKNAAIIYSPFIMGRLEEIWGCDVNSFKLNRDHDKKTQYDFPCFNAGPRICLGKNFAILEAKVIVSKLLANFKFTAEDNKIFTDAEYSLGVTTAPKGKIMVYAERK